MMVFLKSKKYSLKPSVLAVLVLMSSILQAQDCRARISLLTCSPGSELYSIFGHSALRVVDSSAGTDIVYNYGTFSFGEPGFYTKFIRGKLLYYLSQEYFQDFAYSYALDQRSITEQVLNLDCVQRKRVMAFVRENLREENKYYRYDFMYDNCTTRLRDIIEKYRDSSYVTDSIATARYMTFREAIHYYLNRGQMHWSKLGIDLLLGSPIDKKMTNREAMFLPEFLEQGLDVTGNKTDAMVKTRLQPVKAGAETVRASLFKTPFFIFMSIAFVVILLSLSPKPALVRGLNYFDKAFFFLLGILGVLFVFMWLGTDHRQTKDNYNLLWAWPTHVAAIFLSRGNANRKWYFIIYSVVVITCLAFWKWLPQDLNPALIPILAIAAVRSFIIQRSHGTYQKRTS
jgi:hypothetical protein